MKKTSLIIASFLVLLTSCARNDKNYPATDRNYSTEKPECTTDADWQITTKVKAALMADSTLSASARFVSVTTNDGVVTLTGNVPTREQARTIESKVKAVNGVRKVDNQLTINP